jgi:hypothetical protein
MSANKVIYANFTHGAFLSTGGTNRGPSAEGFLVTLMGDLGGHYEMDGSSNLLDWAPLTNLTNAAGTVQFLDSAATNLKRRFYRAVQLP